MLTTSAKSSEESSEQSNCRHAGQFSGFERTASVYDLIHKDRDLTKQAAMIGEELGSPPKNGACLLDWGAGTGSMLPHWKRLGWVSLGMDKSPEMIAAAAAKGITVNPGDLLEWPQGYTVFEAQACLFATFSYACLSQKDLERVVSTLRWRATSGGMLVFDCLNYACAVSRLQIHNCRSATDGTRTVVRTIDKIFDPVASILKVTTDFLLGQPGGPGTVNTNDEFHTWRDEHTLRAFTPTEIAAVLDRHDFDVVRIFNPESGHKESWGVNEYACYMMVTARAR